VVKAARRNVVRVFILCCDKKAPSFHRLGA